MKRIYYCLGLIGAIALSTGCDKGFVQVNTNPTLPTSVDPVYLFANAEYNAGQSTLFYQDQIVQQMITPFTGVLEGGNHNVVYDPNSNVLFNNFYTAPGGAVVLLTTVIQQTKGAPLRSNLYNMARILKAYIFSVLVDTYGDVPYSQAGQAYLSGVNLPKYDDQKAIYTDILNELDQASAALDASKSIETNDLFYKGVIAQWKKLGYSLLLRVAMRYTKADVTVAQKYVTIAFNGGVMTGNADNALVPYDGNAYANVNFNSFQGTEKANYYLGEPFVSYLKGTNDPRLSKIAVKYDNPGAALGSGTGNEDTLSADQQGMPYGYSEATIATAPGYPGKVGNAWKYSQVNRRTVAKAGSSQFLVTHAQTQLLLAEAASRGWVSGNAETYYNAGVHAHMDQMTQFDVTAAIPTGLQNDYLTAHPYDAGHALEQINTQYWIASFLNGAEAWANFRRSGFPALTANPYPSADPAVKGAFIHRLVYPVREQAINPVNYNEAVSRMGADNLATHVFWDK